MCNADIINLRRSFNFTKSMTVTILKTVKLYGQIQAVYFNSDENN